MHPALPPSLRAAALALVITLAGAPPAPAAGPDVPGSGAPEGTPSWTQVKCERYSRAWEQALARRGGTAGLDPDFIARHGAFIASGCTARADVCPRSREEFALANVLTIAAMNAGMASTFLPFACR